MIIIASLCLIAYSLIGYDNRSPVHKLESKNSDLWIDYDYVPIRKIQYCRNHEINLTYCNDSNK